MLIVSGCATFNRNPVAQNVISARQFTHQGASAIQQGRWGEAEALFARAVDACPLDQHARGLYAEALWRRGACDEAIAQLQTAVDASGGDPEKLVRLGEMRLHVGDVEGAARQANAALNVAPQMTSAWVLRGESHRQSGEFERALACYHRALSYEPHLPPAQLAAADVYRQMNRPRRALAALDSLSRQFPPGQTPPEVLLALGAAQKELGRHSDAAETLAAASSAGIPSAELLYQLADAQWRAGDPVNARISAERALRQAPDHAASRQLIDEIDSRQRMAALNVQSLPWKNVGPGR